MQQITDQAEAREQRFRNSEWGPEANEELIEAVHAFPVTFGGTLGEIIDATPKDRISKVMLEEKLFDTWYHDNVVLIGDGKSTGGCCFFQRERRNEDVCYQEYIEILKVSATNSNATSNIHTL